MLTKDLATVKRDREKAVKARDQQIAALEAEREELIQMTANAGCVLLLLNLPKLPFDFSCKQGESQFSLRELSKLVGIGAKVVGIGQSEGRQGARPADRGARG